MVTKFEILHWDQDSNVKVYLSTMKQPFLTRTHIIELLRNVAIVCGGLELKKSNFKNMIGLGTQPMSGSGGAFVRPREHFRQASAAILSGLGGKLVRPRRNFCQASAALLSGLGGTFVRPRVQTCQASPALLSGLGGTFVRPLRAKNNMSV